MSRPIISALGADALLFEAQGDFTLAVQQRIWTLAHRVTTWTEVAEAVPGVTNLMIVTRVTAGAALRERLLQAWQELETGAEPDEAAGRLLEVPVIYDGEDIEEVARLAGLSRAEIITRHSTPIYNVFAIGSHPGFGYLGPLDPALLVPRRAVPRISMPGGTVSIAGSQTGISASDGPTGWHVLGHTTLRMFTAGRTPPALLKAGDRVRLVPVDEQ